MKKPKIDPIPCPTSWEKVSGWYDKTVGEQGHYYHRQIIIPKIKERIAPHSTLLDLACGQGILSRSIDPSVVYIGVDASISLIEAAKEKAQNPKHTFLTQDVTLPLPIQKKDFDFCSIILALQNLAAPLKALKNAHHHLKSGGKLFLVMNHPCFRIPQHSSWGIDAERNIQYRRLDSYTSSLKIPIQAKPSLGERSKLTYSFHHPLSSWINWLHEAGFYTESMEEWCSDKKSTGKYAQREDISREEFPLFLMLTAVKIDYPKSQCPRQYFS